MCYGQKGCDRDDILLTVDKAIENGVNLSLSLGGESAADFSDDPISLEGYTPLS